MEDLTPVDANALSDFIQEKVRERNMHPNEEDFRIYIQSLLATFMPEEYTEIYMSDEPQPVMADIQPQYKRNASHKYGPFSMIRRAFIDEKISELNLTTLEFYGDKRLGMVVQLFIMTNFPNIRSAEQLTNMLKYYTNNSVLAKFADQLDMPAWLHRDSAAGVLLKEKANIFEAFIGAILLIGEIFIGWEVGESLTRIFLEKFLSLQEWTLNGDFYVTPSTLLNDWLLAIPQYKKPTEKKKSQQLADGSHTYSYSLEGEVIEKMSGHKKVYGTGTASQKADAKEIAIAEISEKIHLTRQVIEDLREEKRSGPDWKALENRIYERYPNAKKDNLFRFPNAKRRGGAGKFGKFFFYIEKKTDDKIGGYYEAYTRGIGNTELEAFKAAVDALLAGEVFSPVYGTDFYLNDPDSEISFLTPKNKEHIKQPYAKPESKPQPNSNNETRPNNSRPNNTRPNNTRPNTNTKPYAKPNTKNSLTFNNLP